MLSRWLLFSDKNAYIYIYYVCNYEGFLRPACEVKKMCFIYCYHKKYFFNSVSLTSVTLFWYVFDFIHTLYIFKDVPT